MLWALDTCWAAIRRPIARAIYWRPRPRLRFQPGAEPADPWSVLDASTK